MVVSRTRFGILFVLWLLMALSVPGFAGSADAADAADPYENLSDEQLEELIRKESGNPGAAPMPIPGVDDSENAGPTEDSDDAGDDYTDASRYVYDDDDDEDAAGTASEPPPPTRPEIKPRPPISLPDKVLTIGRIPYLSLRQMMAQVQPLFAYLRKTMGVKEVRLVTSMDYVGVLQALDKGTIDLAWVGPLGYVRGQDQYSLVPLAKTRHPVGPTYRGVFITHKESGILGLDDIKGRTIGFVEPESASGYLYPLHVLQRVNIDPHKQCAKVVFLKRHDAVIRAVLERKVDAGACIENALDMLKDPALRQQILVLGKTHEMPSDVFVCREDCPTNLRERFLDAILKFPKPNASTFLPATDGDFDAVRGVIKAVTPLIPRR